MAGLTYVVNSRTDLPGKQLIVAKATFDDSYPTGGETVLPSALSLYSIDVAVVFSNPNVTYNLTTGKLQITALDTDAIRTEVANASDQSAVSVSLLIIGRP